MGVKLLEHVWNALPDRDEAVGAGMPFFRYGKERAEAAVTCRTLAR